MATCMVLAVTTTDPGSALCNKKKAAQTGGLLF